MTRKVTFIAMALACVALLAPAGATAAPANGIQAASAPDQQIRSAALFAPLTNSSARRLAVKLARQAANERNVRWWQLSRGVRTGPNQYTYDYADRKGNVYCTSLIRVDQPSRRLRRTSFFGGECNGVPSEALAIEAASARFIRAVGTEAEDIYEARASVEEELLACERIRVPRNRLRDVETLFDAYQAYQLAGTITAPVNALINELASINPQRPELAPGGQHWAAFDNAGFNIAQTLIAPGNGTEARDEPCKAIRRWARAGWTAEAAPAFFGDLRRELAAMAAAERGLLRVARALAALGVSPRASLGFTPAGVLELAAPEIETCTGQQQAGCS